MKKFLISFLAAIGFNFAFNVPSFAYFAEEGDTLYKIAKWHQMDLQDIIDMNPHIKNPDHIHAGEYIIVRSMKPQEDVVAYARALQEITAYKVGGNNFPYEVDAAKWVQGVYQKFGIELPPTFREQAVTGEPVDFDELQAGDLMFFSTRADKEITHCGIYMGENLWISNFNPKDDVEIMNSWGSWSQDFFLWGTRFKA